MNVKIYKNALLDFIVVMFDIFMMICSGLVGFRLIHLIDLSYSVDYVQIAVYICLTLFIMWAYDLYSSIIRDRYELKLSVALSNIVAMCGCIVITAVRDLIILHHIQWLSCANAVFMAAVLSVCIYLEKKLYVKVIKSFEGNVKLLVLDDSSRENAFAKKIKYSALSVYDAWYIMVNDDNPEEVDQIIETMYPKYNNIFVSPSIEEKARRKFVSSAVTMGKDLYLMPELYNSVVMKSTLMEFDDTPALKIKKFGLTNFERFCKRAVDIAFALVGSVVAAPVMLVCAIAVKLDSPGPVFYKQERLTLNKKPFYIYKFRSMINDAEKNTGPVLATYGDPRITRVGKILRATRLDELPQLLNVLEGSMSVVGPRPERRTFIEQFEKEIPDYDKRFFVKAGITGMSHVYARYDTSAQDRALFDMLYIRDYSFMLDVKIMFLTLKIMFMKTAAEGVHDNQYRILDRNMETPEERGLFGKKEDGAEMNDGNAEKQMEIV